MQAIPHVWGTHQEGASGRATLVMDITHYFFNKKATMLGAWSLFGSIEWCGPGSRRCPHWCLPFLHMPPLYDDIVEQTVQCALCLSGIDQQLLLLSRVVYTFGTACFPVGTVWCIRQASSTRLSLAGFLITQWGNSMCAHLFPLVSQGQHQWPLVLWMRLSEVRQSCKH